MSERCSTCRRVLLWWGGRLICANPNCTTGHREENQSSLIRFFRRNPVYAPAPLFSPRRENSPRRF